MASDTDLERRLRGALLDHAGTDGLPDHVVVDALILGRTSVRRRRRLAGAVASLAVVAGLAVAVVNQDDSQPQPAPAPPSPSTGVDPDQSAAVNDWAASLPEGGAAEVPYLVGTTLVQPDGSQTEVAGTKAEIVGVSVAGPVLLVGTESEAPTSMSWRYVLVRPTGVVQDLPVPVPTCCATEQAVLSPDGGRFTRGDDILDMTDLSVVGQVPEEADILVAWTPVGIVYFVGGGHYFLWRVGDEPIGLSANPGVFATGSDVSLDSCGNIYRLAADGTMSEVSPQCLGGVWAVSPSGGWALTPDWQLVDVATGDARGLTDRVVTNADRSTKVWWNGDDSVLFPAGDWLVRCDIPTAACEQVAGPDKELGLP